MLRGLFVDRLFYQYDAGGRGHYVIFSRKAQIRLALAGLVLLAVTLALAGTVAWGALHLWPAQDRMTAAAAHLSALAGASKPVQAPATEQPPSPAVDEPAPASNEPVSSEPVSSEPVSSEPVSSEPVSSEEVAALRMALDESRQKRAELAAELESIRRTPPGPSQADLDEVQALYDEVQALYEAALVRAEQAEQESQAAARQAQAARRKLAALEPVDEAVLPDRLRALELELELARAASLPVEEGSGEAMELAFTPEEEATLLRIQELEATVAELEAERDMLEDRLAALARLSPPTLPDPADSPVQPARP